MSTDLNELKRYVQNAPKRSLSAGTVSLNITHNLISNNFQEIIFSLDSTVLALKEKIHGLSMFLSLLFCSLKAGSQVYAMDLYLDGKLISSDESNHDKKIGYFSPQLSSTLHVVDTDPFSLAKNRAFDDTSLVKKFTLTDEEYGKRKNTYRAYKEQQAFLFYALYFTIYRSLKILIGSLYFSRSLNKPKQQENKKIHQKKNR